jgi:branched-chain amino acid aminotransferase
VFDAHESGTLQEAFGSGTAAVIAPIGTLGWRGRDISIVERPGSLRERFYGAITGIQYGEIQDSHGWTSVVPEMAKTSNGNGHHEPVADEADSAA